MYLTEQQIERQLNVLNKLAAHTSAKTDFVLITEDPKVEKLYWKLKFQNRKGGYKLKW